MHTNTHKHHVKRAQKGHVLEKNEHITNNQQQQLSEVHQAQPCVVVAAAAVADAVVLRRAAGLLWTRQEFANFFAIWWQWWSRLKK